MRVGTIPMARSTMTDLFHGAATLLLPVYNRLVEVVTSQWLVRGDETSLKMQVPNKRGFVWTFLADVAPAAETPLWAIVYGCRSHPDEQI